MLNNISILMPYRSDNGPRDVIYHWVREFYRKEFPNVEICVADSKNSLFSRSEAINHAAKMATKDIFVIVDADAIYEPKIIEESLELLKWYTWMIPYQRINYISESSTNEILQHRFDVETLKNAEKDEVIDATAGEKFEDYEFVSFINVIPKKVFYEVGGFDERFAGWGGEDDAFAAAVDTICGEHGRLNEDAFHLWHPPAPGSLHSTISHPHVQMNNLLKNQYSKAKGNYNLMLQLISVSKRGDGNSYSKIDISRGHRSSISTSFKNSFKRK